MSFLEFRDLICYQCTGVDCPAYAYPYSVRHLVTGCQACYKQWHPRESVIPFSRNKRVVCLTHLSGTYDTLNSKKTI